jgi:hypothetical protein
MLQNDIVQINYITFYNMQMCSVREVSRKSMKFDFSKSSYNLNSITLPHAVG